VFRERDNIGRRIRADCRCVAFPVPGPKRRTLAFGGLSGFYYFAFASTG